MCSNPFIADILFRSAVKVSFTSVGTFSIIALDEQNRDALVSSLSQIRNINQYPRLKVSFFVLPERLCPTPFSLGI
ncbi:hypothetical protein, partial [Vibrio parahaemolyticus]|uniref:hypothetical protein n=1 Tax=Vibrio parahaemolyticus TaxID=670 RepID=UPI001C60A9B1